MNSIRSSSAFAWTRRAGAGGLLLALTISASARDPRTTTVDVPNAVSAAGSNATRKAKPGRKTMRWFQVGVASWYGQHFQGHRTSTGELFDMYEMTCAHPTLPIGTWVRVTNLKNRRTAFVRVNDRGPMVEGRIVDLSMAAAQAVGLRGVGRVKLEALREGDPEMAMAMMAQVHLPLLPELAAR